MEDKTEVVNNALIFLGVAPIANLDEDGSDTAIAARTVFAAALRETLRAHPWNFAIGRQKLAALADAPTFGWTYQFQLPADCLRVLSVGKGITSWRVEGKRILADTAALDLRYVRKVDELIEWDDLAAAALARNLAAKLCYPITKSTSLMDAQWGMYTAVLKQARGIDALEEPAEDIEEEVGLIAARFS